MVANALIATRLRLAGYSSVSTIYGTRIFVGHPPEDLAITDSFIEIRMQPGFSHPEIKEERRTRVEIRTWAADTYAGKAETFTGYFAVVDALFNCEGVSVTDSVLGTTYKFKSVRELIPGFDVRDLDSKRPYVSSTWEIWVV